MQVVDLTRRSPISIGKNKIVIKTAVRMEHTNVSNKTYSTIVHEVQVKAYHLYVFGKSTLFAR